jgi:hypothetical protein
MGSDILISITLVCSKFKLPARLDYAWRFATHNHFPKLVPAQAKFFVYPSWATRKHTAISLAAGTRIPGQFLQVQHGLELVFCAGLGITDHICKFLSSRGMRPDQLFTFDLSGYH